MNEPVMNKFSRKVRLQLQGRKTISYQQAYNRTKQSAKKTKKTQVTIAMCLAIITTWMSQTGQGSEDRIIFEI